MSKHIRQRREALKILGGLGLGVALFRCGGTSDLGGSTGGGSAATGGGSATGGSGGGTAGTWAVGSGAWLASKSYGNPFDSGVGSSCVVYKSSTAGPCHSNTFDRSEMSEGLIGLPTRVELLVLNASCQPVANAKVEVWHASPTGLYSGAPVNGRVGSDLNSAFCTDNDAAALAAGWFRAYQTTGADGRVTFDTIFPGWYSSRAWHIHFNVSVGSTSYITSQLFADESLKTNVYSTHGSYLARPTSSSGYTTNSTDKVIQESSLVLSNVVMSHAIQSDGSLVMWKAITLQS